MHCLHFLFFVSALHSHFPFTSAASLTEEQLLSKSGGNVTELEGSGEEVEQVLVLENSTLPATSVTTPTVLLSSSMPPKPVRCYDISKKCSKIKALCTREEYKNIMIRQCAKTCGACDQFARLPAAARCRDSFHSCSVWADNGFCHSTFYTLDERKDFCRKSCEDCSLTL